VEVTKAEKYNNVTENTTEGFNTRLNEVEHRISELKN